MKIEFDTSTIPLAEAVALIHMLRSIFEAVAIAEEPNTDWKYKDFAPAALAGYQPDDAGVPESKAFGDLDNNHADTLGGGFPTPSNIPKPTDEVRDDIEVGIEYVEVDMTKSVDPSTWGEELDSEGKPWDATLHTQNRSKTSTGAWKKGRGKGALNILSGEELTILDDFHRSPNPATQPLNSQVPEVPPVPVAPVAPSAPVPPVPEVIPASAPPETQITFPQFLTAVTKEITRNTNFKNVSNDALNQLGLASIGQLNKAPEKMVDYIRITGLMI